MIVASRSRRPPWADAPASRIGWIVAPADERGEPRRYPRFRASSGTLIGVMAALDRPGESGSQPDVPDEPLDFIVDGGLRLRGAVLSPQGRNSVPAALLISGSGPLDRNSNMPGQALNIASALASHLFHHGIASLRYDKRGVAASAGEYLRTGFDEEHPRRAARP
jgi:hypothetical protein